MEATAGRRAVVTGAAGFVGARTAAVLRERGWEVTGVDLRAADGTVAGDITEPGAWVERLAGADLVVHTAAVVDERAPAHAHWHVNVGGTRTVLEACADAGVGRLVHLSSKVVLGRDVPPDADEYSAVRPTGSPYTDTKLASEHLALQFAAEGRLPVTVVRPGDVYGPGGQQWTVRPVELMRQGRFFLPIDGTGVLAPVFVDDLVDGIVAAGTHPDAVGHVLFITGGPGVTAEEFFGHYARMLSRPVRSVSIAAPAARVVAGLVGRAARLFGQEVPLSEHSIEYVTQSGAYRIDKAAAVLGWHPAIDLDEGMARTRAWLEQQGLLA